MPITRLDQLLDAVKSKPRKRIVGAYANDIFTIESLAEATKIGLVEATLVGDEALIRRRCEEAHIDSTMFEIIHEPDDIKATACSVSMVRNGHAQILMKGLVSSDKYMRAILDKEKGLLGPDALLSHIALIELPSYPKLLIVTDAAVIPNPTLKEKLILIEYVKTTAKVLGIENPKIALVCASEQLNPKIGSMVDAAVLSKMADRGQIKGARVDGPMGLDIAVDPESAETKGMKSEVAGDADGFVFPEIDSANIFYKACTKFARCEVAGLVVGTTAPCVLASRADTGLTKLYSIALASLSAQ